VTITVTRENDHEVLLQETHERETYGISMHLDGSIVSITDFAVIVRRWDLRSGKTFFISWYVYNIYFYVCVSKESILNSCYLGSTMDWTMLRILQGHEGKVTGVDNIGMNIYNSFHKSPYWI
jgi:hypothetical protein